MSLYDYFTRPGSVLPKLDSSLSTVVPASTIVVTNEVVKKVICTNVGEEDTACSSQRGAYEPLPRSKTLLLRKGQRAQCNSDCTILFQSIPWPSYQGTQQ